jgi:outer membrane protein assembly factor BamB
VRPAASVSRVAKGRATGRIETGLGLFGLLAIGVTIAIVTGWNPWPRIEQWLHDRKGTVSTPAAAWVQRASGQPTAAGVTSRAVVLYMGDLVESRSRADGSLLWRKETSWAAVAGADDTTVALVSTVDGKGFAALDPYSGTERWKAPDAVGAWPFRDAVVSAECPPKAGCALVDRSPKDGTVRWQLPVSGVPRAWSGANDVLFNLRPLDTLFNKAAGAVPHTLPRYLGFPIDHRIQVVDTGNGRRLREDDLPGDARAVIAGNRIIYTSAVLRDGSCRYTVKGRDAASGNSVWQADGYDLRTAGGAGCEPRRDPPGGGVVLVGTRGDNRDTFLSAVSGRELATTEPGERIAGTDGEYGLVRSVDGKKLRAIALNRGGATVWARDVAAKARVGMTPFGVFVADSAGERLTVVDAASGQVKLNISTSADVLGMHADGVVLARGRTVGFMGFGVVA